MTLLNFILQHFDVTPEGRFDRLKLYYDSDTLTIYFDMEDREELCVTVAKSMRQFEKCQEQGLLKEFGSVKVGVTTEKEDLFLWCEDDLATRKTAYRVISLAENAGKVVSSCCKAAREDVLHLAVQCHFEEFEAKFTKDLEPEDLKFLLENVSTNKLRITEPIGVWKYHRSLQQPNITLYLATWLSLDCLIEMKTRNLKASETELQPEDLNEILKRWMSGKLEHLEKLYIQQKTPHVISSVTQGIEVNEWHPPLKVHEDHKKFIQRDDGLRATLFVSESELGLWPWNEKFLADEEEGDKQ